MRSETLQAVVVLFAVLNAGFYPSLWGNRTLMMSARDVHSVLPAGAYGAVTAPSLVRSPDSGAPGWQFEPAMAFNHQQFWRQHHFPLWNPYMGYGAPWAAGMLSQPFFPLSFLLALHPTPRTVSWFLLLRLLTAGVFAYLFLKYFVRHAAAVTGAIACMLTGYFVVFLNIDHMSTEVLIPLVFYAMESVVRHGDAKRVLLAAMVIFLVIISGMPESTLLILLYGYAYFLFRSLTVAEFRQHFGALLRNFVLANVLGFGLAAYQLLPFVEFLGHGLDIHRGSMAGGISGLVHVEYHPGGPLVYLLPLVTGPLFRNIFEERTGELYGYFGVTVVALGVMSLFAIARNSRRLWRDEGSLLTAFFFLSAVAFCLKIYGNQVVNWVGYLPGLSLVHFPKYVQPLAGFAVAMLCGFGASYVFSRRARLAEVLAAPLLVLGLIAIMAAGYRVDLVHTDKSVFYFYLSLIGGIIGLMLLTAALAMTLQHGELPWEQWTRRLGRGAVLALVAIELLGNYIYPIYHHPNVLPSARLNPYAGAPYVRFLKQQSGDYYRVFARQGYLYPNWSSAFGLYDVRYIYGISWKDFILFIRAFLAPGPLKIGGDLADRFTGDGFPYAFGSWKERRFLQLSSIRYLVSGDPYLSDLSPLITDLLAQDQKRIKAESLAVSRRSFLIDGEARDVLFAHPPAPRLALSTLVPAEAPMLTFSPAFDPAVFGGCGDGVDFTVELEEANGKISPLYKRYVDAKHNASDQHWLDSSIDLGRYAGQKVTLLFSTSGGPRGDTSCDWAGWASLRFARVGPAPKPAEIFRPVYEGEALVYEYSDSLPRASVFYSVVPVDSRSAALARIQDPALDVLRQVVVSTDGADSATRRSLEALSYAVAETAQAASIMFYDSQRVRVRASLKQLGIVMLTDSDYPGWNAYLDGRRVPILASNYLFRGVVSPAGTHQIEFRYEPLSYLYGGLISIVALLGGLAWFGATTRPDKTWVAWFPIRNAGQKSDAVH
jgi:hypothetical protein